MNKYVFMMLGYVGSGKSYVSQWLAPHVGAVHLRTDDLRLAMFGIDRLSLHGSANKALVNNASRYAMQQILKSGRVHVVHDANHNTKKVRRSIAVQAGGHNAIAVVVWVQTPLTIAKERTEIRRQTEGRELFERGVVEKMAKRLEAPDQSERVIYIDGQVSALEQQKSFDEQWAAIRSA